MKTNFPTLFPLESKRATPDLVHHFIHFGNEIQLLWFSRPQQIDTNMGDVVLRDVDPMLPVNGPPRSQTLDAFFSFTNLNDHRLLRTHRLRFETRSIQQIQLATRRDIFFDIVRSRLFSRLRDHTVTTTELSYIDSGEELGPKRFCSFPPAPRTPSSPCGLAVGVGNRGMLGRGTSSWGCGTSSYRT